eukprot:scaffold8732_cov39-Tisochrysis_lutea.AAC.7
MSTAPASTPSPSTAPSSTADVTTKDFVLVPGAAALDAGGVAGRAPGVRFPYDGRRHEGRERYTGTTPVATPARARRLARSSSSRRETSLDPRWEMRIYCIWPE